MGNIPFATMVKQIRDLLDVDPEVFAQLIGVAGKTVRQWESGKSLPAAPLQTFLANMLRIVDDVRQYAPPEEVVRWLTTPDPDFDDQPPMDLLASRYATKRLANVIVQTVQGLH